MTFTDHFLLLLITLLTLACSCSAKVTYDGYSFFNVTAENNDQLSYLRSLEGQRGANLKLRFFHSPMPNRIVDILVAPESVAEFKKELQSRNITYFIKTEDFQKAIDTEQDTKKETRVMTFKDSSSQASLVTTKYLRMSEIDDYVAGLLQKYPNLVQTENIGTTYEYRPLTVVKVGTRNGTAKKPAIWIDSGIHAREWIAPATGLFILNKLVTNYDRDPAIRQFVESINWYFLPVMNPDGYEYTHTQDRMWRKNRRRSSNTQCTSSGWFDTNCCEGVDLNRNFAYNWGGSGASADPCDEIYRGPSAFSEPESKAVRDFIQKHTDIRAFFTMHSYSQMWFYPFGDKKHSYSSDKDELANLALKAASALKALYGTTYKVGTAADILYESSGGSDDWAKGVANVKYVYGLELRPSDDDSRYGFILPATFIVPTGEETWAAVRVVAEEVMKKYASVSTPVTQYSTVQYSTSKPFQNRPVCNNKSSSCWWFQSSGYCQLNSVQQLCPLACRLCTSPNQ